MNKQKFILFISLFSISFFLFTACKKAETVSNNGIVVTTSLKNKESLVGNIPCVFPLSKEADKLNIMFVTKFDVNQSDVFVWKKYKEMTGIDINWIPILREDRSKELYDALINKKQVDLVLRARTSQNSLTKYGQNGLILDLAKDNLLKKNAPNCWAYLQSHPETLSSIMNPDGTIYALPQVNSGPELRVSRKLLINKTWLKNVNKELPKTTEEFYQLLKAFKEQDANGNGNPNDEIPFCSQDWASIQDVFFGAFGLANRGLHNQMVDYNNKDGKVRLIAATTEYKEYLKYLHKLYSEQLLDNFIFTITQDQWYNYATNDMFGAFANTNLAGLPADKADNWVAVEEALEGPLGDKLWTAIRANFHSTGAAIIPATCSNPELVLRWLDYFWTDEGTLFYHMGIENETFVVNTDGSYDYSQDIYNEIKTSGLTFDDVVARYSPFPGGGNPTVEIAPYFKGGEMATVPANAARQLFKYGPDEYWPSFTFTQEENDNLLQIQNDINKYVSNMRLEFITGTKSFEAWDEYVNQLKALELDKLLEIYQAAVDRYYVFSNKK